MVKKNLHNIDAEVWNNIIIELSGKSEELVLEIARIRDYILDSGVVDELLLFGNNYDKYIVNLEILLNDPDIGSVCVAGVDSSTTPPLRLGPYFISAISASMVFFVEGPYSEPWKYSNIKVAIAPEKADPEYAIKELQLEMFELEVKELINAISIMARRYNKGYIFLDGPIVDPPKFSAHGGLKDRYLEYINNRSLTIINGYKYGTLIIGYVKRIFGNLLSSKIGALSKLKAINDYTLATLILQGIAGEIIRSKISELDFDINKYDAIVVTKPFELEKGRTDYSFYKENGLNVYYFYLLPGLFDYCRRVVRIEFSIPDNVGSENELIKLTWTIAKLIYAWIIPGQGHPIPVILSHKTCTIPRKTSKKLLREVLTRYATKVLKSKRSFDLSMAINLSSQLID